ncbi:MAG: hypothetical protein ACD_56C00107G0005 [uncultured bacterium]|nr:MAG: hypothetical protein ACD_56C00107G0005 [uncultured bacterium]
MKFKLNRIFIINLVSFLSLVAISKSILEIYATINDEKSWFIWILFVSAPYLLIALVAVATYLIIPLYNYSSIKVNSLNDITWKVLTVELVLLIVLNYLILNPNLLLK